MDDQPSRLGDHGRYPAIKIDMPMRAHVIIASFIGCLVSALSGLYLMLRFGSPVLPSLVAILLPPLVLWKAGGVDLTFLAKVSISASVGWTLGFNLAPDRTRSLQDISESWHGENDRFITATALCSIFVITTACFARLTRKSSKSIIDS